MFFIVVNHFVMSVSYSDSAWFPHTDYMLQIENVTKDPRLLTLAFFRYGGSLGNDMFLLTSAWFLVDSKRNNKRKWLTMLLDIWVIAVLFLIVSYPLIGSYIPLKGVIKSILPTTFSSNWYMTHYLILYLMYPYLNRLIGTLRERELLRIVLVLDFLYLLAPWVYGELFEASHITAWVAIYFTVAYLKKYRMVWMENRRLNGVVLVAALFCNVALFLVTDLVGFYISPLSDALLRWTGDYSVLNLLTALAGLNLVRGVHLESPGINAAASLTMYIYLLHENVIFRTYFRREIADALYHAFGWEHVVALVLAAGVCTYFASMGVAWLYQKSLHRLVEKMAGKGYEVLRREVRRLEERNELEEE